MSDALSARLEQADVGSRELSDEVLLACGWTHDPKHRALAWQPPTGYAPFAPDGPSPTQSLDDAVCLIPEGWNRNGLIAWPGRQADVRVASTVAVLHSVLSSGGGPKVIAFGSTRALAVCAAVLKIRERSTAQ